MKVHRIAVGEAEVTLSIDDVWTLRHCAIEALEALGNETEFRVRVGAGRADARALVSSLKELGMAIERSNDDQE